MKSFILILFVATAALKTDMFFKGSVLLKLDINSSHSVLSLFVQFKKSGKEPKAGAELVFGNTTYKTKV